MRTINNPAAGDVGTPSTTASPSDTSIPSKVKASNAMAVAALGVVFGDIGTSPLYAFKQCLTATNAVDYSRNNVLGLLSLIVWSLLLVISVKYVAIMLKADNRGEGGVLALSTLLTGITRNWKLWTPIGMFGIIGAALFFGDGFITPAISVLSAAEGLSVIAPDLQRFVIPLTLVVLVMLFMAQKKGTGKVGRAFGPIMILWFVVIGVLGLLQIARTPDALAAMNPMYGFNFFRENGLRGFLSLSSVFLAVTGGEALYADMGHFGRLPIRNAWYRLVLPALLLNYFGQGALLLQNPAAAENPFYLMVPTWGLVPLLLLATCATVIASQAVISGVFSVTSQALNLGYLPRITLLHSSEDEIGQVYVPTMNWVLFLGTVALVLGFKSSDALGGAYGIAVSSTMLIAGLLVALRTQFTKPRYYVATMLVLGCITTIDLAFFLSNLFKFTDGGWIPIGIAVVICFVMTTWHEGKRALNWTIAREQTSSREFVAGLQRVDLARVDGTAVYLTSEAATIPRALTQNLKFNRTLHTRNILLTFARANVPRLASNERIKVENIAPGIDRVIATYGFMESPNAVAALRAAQEHGIAFKPDETLYVVGREHPLVTNKIGMVRWRKRLFALMNRNSRMAPEHFGVPAHRLLEVGTQTAI